MDYKYIEQLLERYWQGETTLQEEAILRSFYSQMESGGDNGCHDIPESISQYRQLFTIGKEAPLGDDFDERILAITEGCEQQKAKTVTLVNRLKPLFKAAAIVAIVLTLGNAAQAPWNYGWDNPQDEYAKFHQQHTDSVNMLTPIQAEADTVMKPKAEETKYYE